MDKGQTKQQALECFECGDGIPDGEEFGLREQDGAFLCQSCWQDGDFPDDVWYPNPGNLQLTPKGKEALAQFLDTPAFDKMRESPDGNKVHEVPFAHGLAFIMQGHVDRLGIEDFVIIQPGKDDDCYIYSLISPACSSPPTEGGFNPVAVVGAHTAKFFPVPLHARANSKLRDLDPVRFDQDVAYWDAHTEKLPPHLLATRTTETCAAWGRFAVDIVAYLNWRPDWNRAK
jgi:hypothetical protein